eukprot:8233690-Alexandrium_andersonii.AAC.1
MEGGSPQGGMEGGRPRGPMDRNVVRLLNGEVREVGRRHPSLSGARCPGRARHLLSGEFGCGTPRSRGQAAPEGPASDAHGAPE